MPKPAFYLVAILSFLFCLPALAPAEETLTITTYYPSPYGVYRELRSQRMAIGDNYIQSGTYDWETADGDGGEIDYRADLVVEGNVGIGTVNPVAPLTVYHGTAGTPATSGSSGDYSIAMRMHVSSIGLDFGTYTSGTSWIQNRLYNNYASNYNLVLQPNGGNLGIGKASPTSSLHIYRSTAGSYTDNALKVETPTGYATFGSINSSWFHIGTSLPQFYFNNPCQAVGGFSTYSSRDKKQDIRHLSTQEEDKILESLLKIPMSRYRYKDEHFNKKVHLGVIADESPEQILTIDKKAVEMMDYISYAITAIKAQQREIESIRKERQTELKAIKKELAKLKAKVK
jgi:hypothetical protein